jgi:hypothetical protein
VPRFTFADLGGGLNQGQPPGSIKDNEFVRLRNFYPFSTKLRRRGGMRVLNSAAYAERITGIFPYRPSTATSFTPVLGSLTTLAKLSGTSIVAIPALSGFAIGTSTRPWTMFQYKDVLYALRASANAIVRCDGTYYGPSGITAPASAPTIADGAAGAVPAADFYGVFTYYNPTTNVESDPSPASAKLTHTGSKKIDWSGVLTSSNAQVGARRLYRTLPNQTGEYYFVGQIDNNIDTTFTGDNVLVQDMGEAVSFQNGLPPDNVMYGAVWKERLFVTDEVDVFYSEQGRVECFNAADNYIPVFPDDGAVIRALCAYGDRLVIGKTNKIHYLVGSDPDNFALLTLSDRHGCVSHHSMQTAEGLLFWLGPDNVYRSDGNAVTGIATVKLRTILDSASSSSLRDAVGLVFPELSWYVLVIPGVAELVYNYKTDAWCEIPTAAGMSVVGDYFDSSSVQQIYASDTAGFLYRVQDPTYNYDDSGTTLGGAITAVFETKPLDAQDPASRILISRLHLLAEQYAETVTLEWIHEGTATKTRVVSLDYPERWKTYAFGTRQAPRPHIRLRLTYTGASAVEFEGFAVDMDSLRRFATRPH